MKHSTSQALRKNAQGGNTITRTEHSDYQKGEKMSEDLQEQAKEKLAGQSFLIEQLSHEHIYMLTVLDAKYPRQLKSSLKREQLPPILFYAGDQDILQRQTIEKIEAGQVLVLSQEKSDAALHADQLSLFGATGE